MSVDVNACLFICSSPQQMEDCQGEGISLASYFCTTLENTRIFKVKKKIIFNLEFYTQPNYQSKERAKLRAF